MRGVSRFTLQTQQCDTPCITEVHSAFLSLAPLVLSRLTCPGSLYLGSLFWIISHKRCVLTARPFQLMAGRYVSRVLRNV